MSTESLQPVAIFWDIENCAVPHGVNAEEVAVHIRRTFKGDLAMQGPIRVFSAYGDFSQLPRYTRQGCQKTGVNLIDIPNGKKDAADKAILADMFLFALDNPPPGTILLISGDVDFAPALHKLGQRGYSVVLAIPSGLRVSPALCNACQYLLSWPDVARGKGASAVRASLTCINNDVKPMKMVVQNVKKDCTDHFKSKYVAKDISKGGALGKHESDHKVVTGPRNVVKGPSCTSEVTTRIPDGIFEEQVKVPSQFAKVFEAMAVTMGMGNLGTHGKVTPFTPQDMRGDAHDAVVAEAGNVAGESAKNEQVEHHSPVTRLQNVHNDITVSNPRQSASSLFKVKKKDKKEKVTSPCKQSAPLSFKVKKKDKEKVTSLCEQSVKVKKKMKKSKGLSITTRRKPPTAAARLAGLEHVCANIRIATESFHSSGG